MAKGLSENSGGGFLVDQGFKMQASQNHGLFLVVI